MSTSSAFEPSATARAVERPAAWPRSRYRRFVAATTRWSDNDAYGHLNNVVYYSLFDSAVNSVLIDAGALDLERGPVLGFVVETHCNFFSPLAFPQPLEVGIAVAEAGRSSVRFELGVFAAGAALSAARGHFVHVYVDRESRRPSPLPTALLHLARALQ